MKKVCVAGSGSFGTAIANSMHERVRKIDLYSIEPDVIKEINEHRRNTKYFPLKKINSNIVASGESSVISNADVVLLALPSHAILDFVKGNRFKPETLLVNLAKGFSKDGLLINQSLSKVVSNRICSLKGPSFASELMAELPTAFTFGSRLKEDYDLIRSILREELIILDHTEDITGMEILSILKNVYSIIIGIVDAYYNSANVRFMIFTKAISEIKDILVFYRGDIRTINNYCGIGDFGLTSLNDLSRNRTFGLLIGKGFFNSDTRSDVLLEGVRGIEQIINDLQKDNADHEMFRMIFTLNKVLRKEISIQQFIDKIIHNR